MEINWYERKKDIQTLSLVKQLGILDLYITLGRFIYKDDIQGFSDVLRLEKSFVVNNLLLPIEKPPWQEKYS